jgi:hypothetical protein
VPGLGRRSRGARQLGLGAGRHVSPDDGAERGQARSGSDVKKPSGPVVVHVRNAKSGEIDVFSGTTQTRLRDKELAARIVRTVG